MAIKITKPTDLILTENLIIVLYGAPGAGKTSLAFSAHKPLLLDFDLGAQRALNRKDTVRVTKWADIVDLTAADLKDFDTIIVDTAGRLLETMTTYIISSNAKMENRFNGGLSLQGYGMLNTMFKNFILKLKSYGKDIVFVCHDKEEKQGDKPVIRPDAAGSNKVELVKIADLLGYVGLSGKDRVLSFNPTEEYLGKNCAEIPDQLIPHLAKTPDFLANIITTTKNKINDKTASQIKAEQEFNAVLDDINALETVEDFNKMMLVLKDADPLHKQALVRSAMEKGIAFHKEKKEFCAIIKSDEEDTLDLPDNPSVISSEKELPILMNDLESDDNLDLPENLKTVDVTELVTDFNKHVKTNYI